MHDRRVAVPHVVEHLLWHRLRERFLLNGDDGDEFAERQDLLDLLDDRLVAAMRHEDPVRVGGRLCDGRHGRGVLLLVRVVLLGRCFDGVFRGWLLHTFADLIYPRERRVQVHVLPALNVDEESERLCLRHDEVVRALGRPSGHTHLLEDVLSDLRLRKRRAVVLPQELAHDTRAQKRLSHRGHVVALHGWSNDALSKVGEADRLRGSAALRHSVGDGRGCDVLELRPLRPELKYLRHVDRLGRLLRVLIAERLSHAKSVPQAHGGNV